MTLRQTLAVGAGCCALPGIYRRVGLGSAMWRPQAKSAFSHCGHSCCLTARTYLRIQMDAGTPAPSAKPSSAQPVSCCSLLRQPGSPSQQPWDKPRKPTESTAAESTSSFCPPRVILWDRTQGGKALLLEHGQRESKQLFQEDLVG